MTAKHYNKAINHINKNKGNFDERYLQNALERDSPICNYCVEQRIYLAAKEREQLPQFHEAQKKYSKNIIPTF